MPILPVADFDGIFDFWKSTSDQFSNQSNGDWKISIDEINARQDQILIELDLLDQKISDIIEIWTSTDSPETVEEADQAA